MTKRKASYKRSNTKPRKDAGIEDIPEIVNRNSIDRGFDIPITPPLTPRGSIEAFS